MPQYGHRCQCGETLLDLRPISRHEELPPCPACGTPMPRDLTVDAETRRVRNANFHTPIEMYSIAPETSEQHKQLVEAGAEFSPGGIPIARNRGEKMRLLELAGMVEMN